MLKNIHLDYPLANLSAFLKGPIKSMTDTMGQEGLVSSRLVLGILPRLSIIKSNLPSRKRRTGIVKTVKAKVNFVSADRTLIVSLPRNLQSAADRIC